MGDQNRSDFAPLNSGARPLERALTNISQTLNDMAHSVVAPGSDSYAQGVVEIVSPDLERMLSFYCALGFKIERRTEAFAVIVGYGVRLFVAENADATTAPRWTNLRIIVSNVDLVRCLAHDLGLPIVHDVADKFYGLRDFVLADPAGFEIRFAQVL